MYRKIFSIFLLAILSIVFCLPSYAVSSVYTGKWIREDGSKGPYTPSDLATAYDANPAAMAGKWVWETKPQVVTISYDANGGYMANTQVINDFSTTPSFSFTFPGESPEDTTNPVSRPGYYLTGWNSKQDGSGTSQHDPLETCSGITQDAILGTGDPSVLVFTFDSDAHVSASSGEGSRHLLYYAQWASMYRYKVEHYQEDLSLDTYSLATTDNLYARPGSSATPDVRSDYADLGFILPSTETVQIPSTFDPEDPDVITVRYYYVRTRYTVHFNANVPIDDPDPVTGSMVDQSLIGGVTTRLYDNHFKRDNYFFAGWNTEPDGSGTHYGDSQSVYNLANDGDTFNLYAEWIRLQNGVGVQVMQNGVFRFTLHPGETMQIPELPAGTSYEIVEVETPDGWQRKPKLDQNLSGVIAPGVVSSAAMTNEYDAHGVAQIVAYKSMNGDAPASGSFKFELYKGTTKIGEAYNTVVDSREFINDPSDPTGETQIKNPYYGYSMVIFEDLTYSLRDMGSSSSDISYTIKEIAGSDSSIEYDTHTETVLVRLEDKRNGSIDTTVIYDSDGPVFENRTVPEIEYPEDTYNIMAKKSVVNADDNDDSFTFTLDLTDKNDVSLGDNEYHYDVVETGHESDYVRIDDVNVSAVSHTQNLNDAGEQLSNYGNNWSNSNIRGTGRESAVSSAHVVSLHGARSLHVTIVYGGESSFCDYVCMWQGSHPEYTAYNNSSSSVISKLGGGSYTASSNTVTYDVPGDTVTFSYYSDGSVVGDGYGYYAVVSATIFEYNYNDYRHNFGVLKSGDTFEMKSGETVIIDGLPSGVKYAFSEASKPGYELVSSSNVSGTVAASTSMALFNNVVLGSGSFVPAVRKTLENGTLSDGQFTFGIYDTNSSSNEPISVATNDDQGVVLFNPIEYDNDDIGHVYTYEIREVTPQVDDNMYHYDRNSCLVEVRVGSGTDGNLSVDVSYSDNDFAFVNTYFDYSDLLVSKSVTGNLGNKHKDFDFVLTMTNTKNRFEIDHEISYEKTTQAGIVETGTIDPRNSFSFTLADSETILFKDIPSYTEYEVVETLPSGEGYTVVSSNETGLIMNDDVNVSFVNNRQAPVPTGVDTRLYLGVTLLMFGLAIGIVLKRKYMKHD